MISLKLECNVGNVLLLEPTFGWEHFQECIELTHFLIDWMFRSFKCVEISLTHQTPGPKTLSKVTGPMRAKHRS